MPRVGKRGSPQRISVGRYGVLVGANPRSRTLQMQRAVLSRIVDDQTRQRNLAISYVVVDVLGQEILTGLIYCHGRDSSTFYQLGDDMVALGVRVRIRGVRDLKCKPS